MFRKKKGWILFGVLAFLLFIFIPWPGILGALRLTHGPTGRELSAFPFILRHSFHISFLNTIYLAPTIEKFEATGSEIRLTEIRTQSWGVVEYYGYAGTVKRRTEIFVCGISISTGRSCV